MAPTGESPGFDDYCELHLCVQMIEYRPFIIFTFTILKQNMYNPEVDNVNMETRVDQLLLEQEHTNLRANRTSSVAEGLCTLYHL